MRLVYGRVSPPPPIACQTTGVNLNGGVSPPGVIVVDSSQWDVICGPWIAILVLNVSGEALDFGTMTLSFFP